VNAVNNYDLWHHCIGYPSKQVLPFLSKDLNVFGSLHKEGTNDYDICYRAKQTSCPFLIVRIRLTIVLICFIVIFRGHIR